MKVLMISKLASHTLRIEAHAHIYVETAEGSPSPPDSRYGGSSPCISLAGEGTVFADMMA